MWLGHTNVSDLPARQRTCRGGLPLLLLHLCPAHSLLPQWVLQQRKRARWFLPKKSPCLSLSTALVTETGYSKIISRSSDGREKVLFITEWPRAVGRALPWAVTPVHHSRCPPHHQGNHWTEVVCIATQMHNLWNPRHKAYLYFKWDQQTWASCLFGRQLPASAAEAGISLAGQVVPLWKWAKASGSMAEPSKKLAWVFCGAWRSREWTPLLPRKDPWDNQWPSLTSFPIKGFLDVLEYNL